MKKDNLENIVNGKEFEEKFDEKESVENEAGENRSEAEKERICTECGKSSHVGYSDWTNSEKEKVVKKDEHLCPDCFKKRNGDDHLKAKKESSKL